MTDPRTLSTGELIRFAMAQFRADRREQMIHAGGRAVRVHRPGERTLWLPNGAQVKVAVDDSGTATQVEESDSLHAIVRPQPIRTGLQMRGVAHVPRR